MANLNLTSPVGWNRWVYPKTTVVNTQLPDAPFPYIYTPANAFWIRSLIDHCLIPWLTTYDPLTLFIIGGGNLGNVIGSISGLAIVAELFNITNASGTFSLLGGYVGPRFGYCIGNKFKQQVYVRFDIQNVPYGIALLNKSVELMENSRFKRIYGFQGTVKNFTRTTLSPNVYHYRLSLDWDITYPPPISSASSPLSYGNIKIYKANGTITSFKIYQILDNWDLSIGSATPVPDENLPATGDFYVLDKPWKLNDPILLSGFWRGFENDLKDGQPKSGYNLAITDQNINYLEGKILGVYIWKQNTEIATTTTTSTVTPSSLTTTTTTPMGTPGVGTNMNDVNGYGWAWADFGNSQDYSQIYKDDTRYKVVYLDVPDADGAIIKYEPRETMTKDEYDEWMLDKSISYVRMEINTGGYYNRHNWYAPCLANQYIKISNDWYKILAHVEANVIDVSKTSVNGKVLDLYSSNFNQSIFNNFGWMINEDYFQSTNSSSTGIFQGIITQIINNEVLLKLNDFPSVATKDYGDSTSTGAKLSLIDRWNYFFKKTYRDFPDHVYPQTIKLIIGRKEYSVFSVEYNGTDESTLVLMISDVRGLSVNQKGYLTADVPYPTVGNFSAQNGFTIELTATPSLTQNKKLGFIVSDQLCLNGEYMSAPYRLDIPRDTRIGICEGYLFGMEFNGSAASRIGAFTLVTTPRSDRGVASLLNAFRQEGWVAFQDPVTFRLTLRRGSLDFVEMPMKSMIAIGNDSLTETNNNVSESISLNVTQEWLTKIQLFLSNHDASPSSLPGLQYGVMFAMGTADNIYGFYISGEGIVDLQVLRREGIMASNVASSTYTGDGYDVSPVYVYKKNYYQNLQSDIVDIGMKPDQGPLIIKGQPVSSVVARYVNDNQTIENTGYYDLVRLTHGETLLIYGTKISQFNLSNENTNYLNNSNNNGSRWNNQNCVMIIGSYDEAFTWLSPLTDDITAEYESNQYPIMVLNGVDYLASLYNPMTNNLYIFARCYKDGVAYIGCYTVSVLTLAERKFICRYPDFVPANPEKSPLSFLWRHPSLPNSFINDTNRSWTDNANIIKDGYDFNISETPTVSDRFIRILGPGSTQCQIPWGYEMGIISANYLPDGVQMLLFDSDAGIRAAFSGDGGSTWALSGLVYAKDARCGVMVGNYLFYITTEGIMVKKTEYINFYAGYDLILKKAAGLYTQDLELTTQADLDKIEHVLVGSGAVEYQRLSGYVTRDGVIKIFFYDANGLLKCIDSTDKHKWKVASNF